MRSRSRSSDHAIIDLPSLPVSQRPRLKIRPRVLSWWWFVCRSRHTVLGLDPISEVARKTQNASCAGVKSFIHWQHFRHLFSMTARDLKFEVIRALSKPLRSSSFSRPSAVP